MRCWNGNAWGRNPGGIFSRLKLWGQLDMNYAISDDQPHWYAVRTKPKEESRADSNLRAYQVQTFAPKLKQLRSSGYGARYSIQPLFPSYIFAYFNAITQLHKVNYTRGVQKVVSFCGCPLSISDEAINLIKDKADDDGFVCLFEELAPGDKVRITSGPLQSLVGVFQRNLSDKERVEILLNTINYQSHLLIGREMVEKIH